MLGLGISFGSLIVWQWRCAAALEELAAELETAEPPRAAIADSDNAVIPLRQAFDLLERFEAESSAGGVFFPWTSLDGSLNRQTLMDAYPRLDPVYALIDDALSRPECQFSTGDRVLTGSLVVVRALLRRTEMRVRAATSPDARLAAALEGIDDVLAFRERLPLDGYMVLMMRHGFDESLCERVKTMIIFGHLDAAKMLDPWNERLMSMERGLDHDYRACMLATHQTSLRLTRELFGENFDESFDESAADIYPRLLRFKSAVLADMVAMLEQERAARVTATMSWHEARDWFAQHVVGEGPSAGVPPYWRVARGTISNERWIRQNLEEARGRLRAERILLAAAAHHAAHATWPASIEELDPLPSGDLRDPLTGRPMILEVDGDELILKSADAESSTLHRWIFGQPERTRAAAARSAAQEE